MSTEILNNLLELLVDLRVINGPRSDSGKSLASLVDAVLLNEPAGRFVGEAETDEEDGAGKYLQSKRHAPLACVRVGHVQRGSVVDEEGETDAGDVEELHATDAAASDFLVGILADVGGDDSTRQSDSKASDDPADVQLCEIVARTQSAGGLDDAAEDEDEVRKEKGSLPTELVGEVEGGHGAKEAAGLQDRDDVSFQRGMVGTFSIEAKAVVERFHREHSADQTGVPAE